MDAIFSKDTPLPVDLRDLHDIEARYYRFIPRMNKSRADVHVSDNAYALHGHEVRLSKVQQKFSEF